MYDDNEYNLNGYNEHEFNKDGIHKMTGTDVDENISDDSWVTVQSIDEYMYN